MKLKLLLPALLVLLLIIYGFYQESDKKKSLSKISTNDDVAYIALNECFMWIGNNGMGSHNPITDDGGFYWPGGEDAKLSAVFADGLIWGANVEGEIRVNGSTYRYGLQAGKILDTFTTDDPANPRSRIYKIRKNWEELPDGPTRKAYQKDYEEWPVEDGAPWIDIDGDGIYAKGIDEPEFLGDEMLWYVANDLDPSRSTYTYGSLPIGLEFQTTVFGFENGGDLGNMVFKKYKIINKSDNFLNSMYVGYWADPDLGNAEDDYIGCDTLLNMGFTYNADNNDEGYYGSAPPALGYVLLQGPIIPYDPQNEIIQRFNLPDSGNFSSTWKKGITNLPMTSFSWFINTFPYPEGVQLGTKSLYFNLMGRLWNGDPFINPNTEDTTKFILAGDPVGGTGWYEGEGWRDGGGALEPGDRRQLMNSGPFSMAPGDTQEVVIGIVIARGSSNIQSIAELRKAAKKAIILSDNHFNTVLEIPIPNVNVYPADNSITLYWETNVEDYDEIDKLKQNEEFDDITYTFEGYILRQYSDLNGTDEKIIASFDVKNDIKKLIETKRSLGNINHELFYEFENKGLERKITITRDSLKEKKLNNNNPYYYSLSAVAVNENSDPMYIESKPNIIEVFPGSIPTNIDDKGNKPENYLGPKLLEGFTDAEIRFEIVDPLLLTGDTYQVTFDSVSYNSVTYSLKNISKDSILLENMADFIYLTEDGLGNSYLENELDKNVLDGFTLTIQDFGREKINNEGTLYAVMDVLEVKGPGGTLIEDPVSVNSIIRWDRPNEIILNSTGEWYISPQGLNYRYNWQGRKNQEGLGYDFYEIRFKGKGSDFFSTGYNNGTLLTIPTKDDLKGDGKVPFEIWNVKQTLDDPSDDERLIVKILDYNRARPDSTIQDNKWSQLPSGNWEEIYAYQDSVLDPDNLPAQSGTSDFTDHKFGALVIHGSQPAEGTVIRLVPAFPLVEDNVFEITMPKADLNSKGHAKSQISKINVFPNPYYATHGLETSNFERYVRFINLPEKATIRIFNLGGTFIQKIEKDSRYDFIDWDLRNHHNVFIASGLYIAYVELPEIGNKILKLAIILEDN